MLKLPFTVLGGAIESPIPKPQDLLFESKKNLEISRHPSTTHPFDSGGFFDSEIV